ncbi:hypothetical protein STHU_10800 [Allostella humosa]|nr:hypothetical protein STHU_10800 [Stella humosa]
MLIAARSVPVGASSAITSGDAVTLAGIGGSSRLGGSANGWPNGIDQPCRLHKPILGRRPRLTALGRDFIT